MNKRKRELRELATAEFAEAAGHDLHGALRKLLVVRVMDAARPHAVHKVLHSTAAADRDAQTCVCGSVLTVRELWHVCTNGVACVQPASMRGSDEGSAVIIFTPHAPQTGQWW